MLKVSGLVMGIIAIVIGILILAVPDLLRWVLGIGFIVVGLLAILRKQRYIYSHHWIGCYHTPQTHICNRQALCLCG